ncbi:MAG: antitoxin [Acidimicrobiales bacterium]
MKFLDQAKALLTKNSSKITDQLGNVGEMIDKKTGGKYSDKITKVTSTVENKLGDLAPGDAATGDDTEIDLSETIDTDAAAKAATDVVDTAADAVEDAITDTKN